MVVLARKPALAAVAALVLCATGCILSGQKGARFAFSHAEHVGEQGLACVNCHADAGRSDEPGMPDPDACGVCHDELDVEKPAEKRVASLFEEGRFRAHRTLALDDELKFSHARHTAAIADCSACHADVAEADGPDVAEFAMDRCTACHDEKQVASACTTCHTTVDAVVAPASHAVDWKRQHGRCARSGSSAMGDRCSLCHTEQYCVQCHREEPPANHTPYWLQRAHGLSAMIDRAGCMACHRSDSCASCHAEQMPQNHTATFGSPNNTHCVSCHFPLRNEGCVACHRDTRSHALAAPKPRDPVHLKGQNCRQCHGLSAPLPHTDNGDDCNACHR